MNFLVEPPESVVPNAKMDDEAIAIAMEFVNELVAIGALG